MKDYVAENERILNKWRNQLNQYEYFAPDGIMYKGEFRGAYKYYEKGEYKFRWMRIPSGRENILWTNAPLRVLFLTKDQNTSGDTAWDVRSETYWAADENVTPEERGIDKSRFNSNLVYILYGILNTTADKQVGYKDAAKEALSFVDEQIFARINCKKEVGGGKCENYDLQKAIDRDLKLLKEQILNLDADIIICCGYSENIEDSGNLLLNFLKQACYYNLKKQDDDSWIYYDDKQNKIAINNWHLSARINSENWYDQLIDAYYRFLKEHPDFSKSHRI